MSSLEARGESEGTQLDKNNRVEWVGIEMHFANLNDAVDFVRQRLRELGAPAGSVLEFTREGQEVTLPIH